MSKAALWNDDSGEFDARETGREPVRRRGRSLVERLQAPINPNNCDALANDVAHRDDDMATRSASEDTDQFQVAVIPADNRQQAASELQLAKAIQAMERRTLRKKQRMDDALEPFNKILERTGSDRDRERVSSLAQRVSEIETRLIDRFAPVEENPVRAALARLEARLEAIGRQNSLADAVALQHTMAQLPKPAPQPDSMQRLEDKLDAILKAIQTRPTDASTIAMTASQGARRWGDRRLGDAIDEIARRQQALEFEDDEPRAYRQAPRKIERAVIAKKAADESASFAAIRTDIAGLATKLDGLCRNVSIQRDSASKPSTELDLIRTNITKVSGALRELASQVDLSSAREAIEGLSQCIESLPDAAIGEAVRPAMASIIEDTQNALVAMDFRRSINRFVERLETVGAKVDNLPRETLDRASLAEAGQLAKNAAGLVANIEAKPPAVERVEYLIGSLKWLIDTRAERSDGDFHATISELRDVVATAQGPAFAELEATLEALDAKVSNLIAGEQDASEKDARRPNVEIEDILRDLSRKLDDAQAPGANHETLNALQEQIALLSSRFESTDDSLAKLNSLQQSMSDVFTHLEQTRASVESSAAEAAREVLRIAIEKGQTHREDSLSDRLAQIQTMQDEAEARNGTALTAVQQTLTKVVDRLSSMEGEIAEVREKKAPAPAKAVASPLKSISLGVPAPLVDKAPERQLEQKTAVVLAPVPAGPAVDVDREDGRADFIAAARRAAKAVQTALPLPELKRPDAPKVESVTRTILLEESRDYIARNKRPILLGIAALFMIVGTLSVAHRIGTTHRQSERATIASQVETAPPAKIVADQHIASAEATPATASHAQVASGPATAVMASATPATSAALPVFAIRPPTPAPPPTIPAKLKTMAQAGDPGAEYVLGTQYAEGRGVARDFKTAAGLYQKAADKGIVPAQYRLAALFEKGLGVGKDKAKARSLYLQAAEAGNPRAMHNLAVLLADGDGKPDYQGAATWFRKAAQYGMEDSQYNLAILLARGLGIQQSMVQSYQWFAIAAAQEDQEAAKKRDEVGSRLGAADLAVAKALAASFHPRAVSVAAVEVQPPPGGWDGASKPSPLNSARSKISSL